MDFTVMRKRAGRITKQRNLRPDMEYILYAAVLSLTLVGLPAAYGIVKEYHSYLVDCRSRFNPKNDGKKIVYPHKSPARVMSGWSIPLMGKMIKAIAFVLLPGALFFEDDRLSDMQNFQIRNDLTVMKSMFFDIFISEAAIVGLIVGIFLTQICYLPVMLAGIAAIILLEFKPFVTYCQALVMYQKICSEIKPETDTPIL